MKKGGRLANYRHGDRAEDFGAVLLQSFCAVARVPRQEDWGVFDAVATVLRKEGKLLFAEASFLVQFKSAGGSKFEFSGAKLASLRSQELPLFVASVNLTSHSIELYPIAPALDDGGYKPETMVFHLKKPKKFDHSNEVYDAYIGPAALRWDLSDTNAAEFQESTSKLLLIWLDVLKSYTQKTKLGIFDKLTWETNQPPTVAGYRIILSPGSNEEAEALKIARDSIDWLAMQAISNDSLLMPVIQICDWFAECGLQVKDGFLRFRLIHKQMDQIICEGMKQHPDSVAAHALISIPAEGEIISFWAGQSDRMLRFTGTADELALKGFVFDVSKTHAVATLINVVAPWINESKVKFLRMDGSAILYGKANLE